MQDTKYLKGISEKQMSPSHASCSIPKIFTVLKSPQQIPCWVHQQSTKRLRSTDWEALQQLISEHEYTGGQYTHRYLIMELQSSICVVWNTVSCIWAVNKLIKKLTGNSCIFVLQKRNVFIKSSSVEAVQHWPRLAHFTAKTKVSYHRNFLKINPFLFPSPTTFTAQ